MPSRLATVLHTGIPTPVQGVLGVGFRLWRRGENATPRLAMSLLLRFFAWYTGVKVLDTRLAVVMLWLEAVIEREALGQDCVEGRPRRCLPVSSN